MNSEATIFIVDDDVAMRDSLALLLGLKGFRTQMFANAENLLSTYSSKWFGCMIVDVRMPGMSGLELHAELAQRGSDVPVIIMTAYGDVATARAALKAGVMDFLEKPVDDDVLIDVLQSAIDAHAALRQTAPSPKASKQLTTREQQVLDLAANGLHVKQIAEKLGISPRTVEVYKSRMAQKLRGRDDDGGSVPGA
jgi:two-component system, LuxR family, response regulator FixJ